MISRRSLLTLSTGTLAALTLPGVPSHARSGIELLLPEEDPLFITSGPGSTVTLPPAALCEGLTVQIKNLSPFPLTVAEAIDETITLELRAVPPAVCIDVDGQRVAVSRAPELVCDRIIDLGQPATFVYLGEAGWAEEL